MKKDKDISKNEKRKSVFWKIMTALTIVSLCLSIAGMLSKCITKTPSVPEVPEENDNLVDGFVVPDIFKDSVVKLDFMLDSFEAEAVESLEPEPTGYMNAIKNAEAYNYVFTNGMASYYHDGGVKIVENVARDVEWSYLSLIWEENGMYFNDDGYSGSYFAIVVDSIYYYEENDMPYDIFSHRVTYKVYNLQPTDKKVRLVNAFRKRYETYDIDNILHVTYENKMIDMAYVFGWENSNE